MCKSIVWGNAVSMETVILCFVTRLYCVGKAHCRQNSRGREVLGRRGGAAAEGQCQSPPVKEEEQRDGGLMHHCIFKPSRRYSPHMEAADWREDTALWIFPLHQEVSEHAIMLVAQVVELSDTVIHVSLHGPTDGWYWFIFFLQKFAVWCFLATGNTFIFIYFFNNNYNNKKWIFIHKRYQLFPQIKSKIVDQGRNDNCLPLSDIHFSAAAIQSKSCIVFVCHLI